MLAVTQELLYNIGPFRWVTLNSPYCICSTIVLSLVRVVSGRIILKCPNWDSNIRTGGSRTGSVRRVGFHGMTWFACH